MALNDTAVWRYNESNGAVMLLLGLCARLMSMMQHTRTKVPCRRGETDKIDSMDHVLFDVSAPSEGRTSAAIKTAFLNHFASLLACIKSSFFVSCTALNEELDCVTVYATRNNAFEAADITFLKDFSASVSDIIRQRTKRKVKELFDLMLNFYILRIVYHAGDIVRFVRSAELKQGVRTLEQSTLLSTLDFFLRSCATFSRKPPHDTVLAANISAQARRLSRSKALKNCLFTCYEKDDASDILRLLRFVARIRTIHKSILNYAETLPSSTRFAVKPVPLSQAQRPTHINIDMAYRMAERSLGRRLHQGSVDAIARRFHRNLVIHAEMQMVFFFARPENQHLKPFQYLGLSNGPCYSCAVFLRQLNTFKSLPGHGRIYPLWTLPRLQQVQRRQTMALYLASHAVEQKLCQLICNPSQGRPPVKRESTIASSIASRSTVNSLCRHNLRESLLSRRARTMAEDLPGDERPT